MLYSNCKHYLEIKVTLIQNITFAIFQTFVIFYNNTLGTLRNKTVDNFYEDIHFSCMQSNKMHHLAKQKKIYQLSTQSLYVEQMLCFIQCMFYVCFCFFFPKRKFRKNILQQYIKIN